MALAVLEIEHVGDGVLRQGELANRLGLDGSAVVRVLDRLERDGLLRRVEDPLDRRAKRLELTDEGHRVGLKTQRIAEDLRERLLKSLEQDDFEAAYRVLCHLASVLDQLESGRGMRED